MGKKAMETAANAGYWGGSLMAENTSNTARMCLVTRASRKWGNADYGQRVFNARVHPAQIARDTITVTVTPECLSNHHTKL
jgi:hypothetical protein